jgi:hypothetical protein
MQNFKKIIESSQHLIIPSVSSWPKCMHFPLANDITIVNWNKKQVYSWLHPSHFPNSKQINYLAKEDLPFGVQILFTSAEPNFKFNEFSCLGLTSKLDEVPWENIGSLRYNEYRTLMKKGIAPEYIENWNLYIAQTTKEWFK